MRVTRHIARQVFTAAWIALTVVLVSAQEPLLPFDRTKLETHTGVVTMFALAERITLGLREGETLYQMAGDIPDGPSQGGWTQTALHVGDTVTAVMRRSNDNPLVGELVSVTTADGIRFATRPPPAQP